MITAGYGEERLISSRAAYVHSFPLKYMQVDSPDLTFQILISGGLPSPQTSATKYSGEYVQDHVRYERRVQL